MRSNYSFSHTLSLSHGCEVLEQRELVPGCALWVSVRHANGDAADFLSVYFPPGQQREVLQALSDAWQGGEQFY